MDIHNNNYFSSGSSIYDKFDYKEVKNLTFVFSKIIEKKNIIPQIILSYQIQSYNFDKYLSKKKLYPKNLLISRKNNKINFKSINYNSNLVKSINFTKDLISEPANTLNPVTYAQRCKKINIQGNGMQKRSFLHVNDFNSACEILLNHEFYIDYWMTL